MVHKKDFEVGDLMLKNGLHFQILESLGSFQKQRKRHSVFQGKRATQLRAVHLYLN
jgi:hypothetical protein